MTSWQRMPAERIEQNSNDLSYLNSNKLFTWRYDPGYLQGGAYAAGPTGDYATQELDTENRVTTSPLLIAEFTVEIATNFIGYLYQAVGPADVIDDMTNTANGVDFGNFEHVKAIKNKIMVIGDDDYPVKQRMHFKAKKSRKGKIIVPIIRMGTDYNSHGDKFAIWVQNRQETTVDRYYQASVLIKRWKKLL